MTSPANSGKIELPIHLKDAELTHMFWLKPTILYFLLPTSIAFAIGLTFRFVWGGWHGAESYVWMAAYLLAAFLPLFLAGVLIWKQWSKFNLRLLAGLIALIAIFLAISLLPTMRYRSARSTGAKLNVAEGYAAGPGEFNYFELIMEEFGIKSNWESPTESPTFVPFLMRPFIADTAYDKVVPDAQATDIRLGSDEACEIFCNEYQRFHSARSVCLFGDVSIRGFSRLKEVLPEMKKIEMLWIFDAPVPEHWLETAAVKTRVIIIATDFNRGPIQKEVVVELAKLPNLEVFGAIRIMFDDDDARFLARSDSIIGVKLRGTAVTEVGIRELEKNRDRKVIVD
ncbi:MAG: hypothetical protein AAFN77_20935 [Planctomycetota bacterium]